MIRTPTITKSSSVWPWIIAAAAATLLGPVFYGCILELGRGHSFGDGLAVGLISIFPAVVFLPHILLAIWIFSTLAGMGLARLRLANPTIFGALGMAVGLTFFFAVFDNPYIGDEEQRRRIAAYFAIAGMVDGFVYWGIGSLLRRRFDDWARALSS